jgi:hypothetical protein
MPTEPRQGAGDGRSCPACGSPNTQQVSAVVEERIRNTIAAHWAKAPGPRGPDGRWLGKAIIVWAGALTLSLVTSTSHVIDAWAWAALLVAALLLGAWADRAAARQRGWIDPLRRAADVARQARERDAARPDAARVAGTALGDEAERERICLHCGHRFVPARTVVSVT